jgi:hypothetical protein
VELEHDEGHPLLVIHSAKIVGLALAISILAQAAEVIE